MDRRHFIQLTGTTLSGLLFVGWESGLDTAKEQVQFPNKIFVLLDDGKHELKSSGKNTWAYEEVAVQLNYSKNAIQVFARSPKKALHNITFLWNYPQSASAKLTGDHWERTYGDVFFQSPDPNKKLPWYFIQYDEKKTTCFGVKTGCHTFCYWQVGKGTMQLIMDTRSGGIGVSLGSRVLHAADIVATQNKSNENTFATARRFCGIMCTHPLLPEKPVYGINDWYVTYGKNSGEIILQHTAMMAEYASDTSNRPFSVIDSGWAAYSPLLPGDCCWQDDYSRPNKNFKDMHQVAGEISKLGMRPGLWTRPLCAAHNDPKNLLLSPIPGRNDPKKPVLDPTIEENLARVKRNITLHREWGFELVKHDFTTHDILGKWGFEMSADMTSPGWRFNDTTRTTAEIILDMYQAIREAAGPIYIIGCNTISHLSAGLFELNRIGDDVSGREWERTAKMGPNTLGFRMVQQKKFYSTDGDCVGLTTKIPWQKNKQWMHLLAESSTPLFISAQKEALGNEQRHMIKQCFESASKELPVAEPLDWLVNAWPVKWRLNGQIHVFDWS